MKKTLIALAAVAATASFAQSSVQITGTFDPSVANQKVTYGDNTAATNTLVRNNSQGTSQVTFKGTEDLGGGLKASFLLENDFDAGKDAKGNWGNATNGGETKLALEGGFGTIAAGAPNTPSLTAQTASNPFGTKIGSGFSLVNAGKVRNNNTVMYSTPVFAGFSAAVAYSFKTKTATATTTADITDIGLSYANGPLAAGASFYKVAGLAGAKDNKETNVYATYDLGVAKLGVGYFTEKDGGATAGTSNNNDSKAFNVSANVPLSANLSLLANYAKKDDKTSTNMDRKIGAIGVKYTLSKNTSVYARYVDEKNDNVTTATASKAVKTTLVGMQTNF